MPILICLAHVACQAAGSDGDGSLHEAPHHPNHPSSSDCGLDFAHFRNADPGFGPEFFEGRLVLVDRGIVEVWSFYDLFRMLSELDRKYADDGLAVLSVSSGHKWEHAEQFTLSYPMVMDPGYRYRDRLGEGNHWMADGILVLVSPDGTILRRFDVNDARGPGLEQAIVRSLDEWAPESPTEVSASR